MDRLLSPFRQGGLIKFLFLSNIFISFHYALIIYINSSLLSNFFSETQISTLYIIGSIVEVFLLLNASKILQKLGNYKFIFSAITFEILSLIGIIVTNSPTLVGFYFLVHVSSVSLLLFNMDVFLEGVNLDESKTGSTRAAYLTISSVSFVLAPLLVSLIVKNGSYSHVYLLSSLLLIPLYFFIKKLKGVRSTDIRHINIRETITEYTENKDLYNIFFSQLTLNLFYAYMVIYTPLYLNKHIGFSWSEIGIIFTIMLLPFVLVELPVGELEDSEYGEKEFLTMGFVIMGLSAIFMSFVTVKVLWIWATILFISRIGASLVEISTESYFFKHVDKNKTNIISFFRASRPMSFIIAPILATIALQFIPFQYIFIIIGSVMIIGAHYSIALRDTR